MIATKVLLVEDEPTLVRGLTDAFRAHGFGVEVATDGEAGLAAACDRPVDLVVLDIMLPRMNGYEVCEAIRARGLDIPILILTAKGQEADVVLGLRLGADDYLTKPFRLGELIARMRALLRRRTALPSRYRLGECDVDLDARVIHRGGATIPLTAKESRLLGLFLRRPGRALDRETILDAVWGHAVFVTPRSIDRCVTTLRAKIEPDPHRPVFIQTLREVGYRFEPCPE